MASTEQSHAVQISAAGRGGWMEGPAEAVQGVTVTLRDGTPLVIRPVNSEDRPAIAALFARLSPQSLYTRFHASTVHISDAVLDLVTADHALVAELEGQIIALASYHPCTTLPRRRWPWSWMTAIRDGASGKRSMARSPLMRSRRVSDGCEQACCAPMVPCYGFSSSRLSP